MLWYWAAKQAAHVYRLNTLKVKLPEDAPTFGHIVLIRDPVAEGKSFTKKLKEGIFLFWDPTTAQGAYICVDKGDRSAIVSTSGPMSWSKKGHRNMARGTGP